MLYRNISKYYFVSEDNGLWVSDGTETGTKIIKSFTTQIRLKNVKNDLLFFEVLENENEDSYGSNYILWRSYGTEDGTFSLEVVSRIPEPAS